MSQPNQLELGDIEELMMDNDWTAEEASEYIQEQADFYNDLAIEAALEEQISN